MTGHAAPADPAKVESVFREVYGQAVATLIRVCGDITLAEDAVQDAFVAATDRWRRDGIPPNPAGWIVTTARNRAIDQHRRSTRGREFERDAADESGLNSELSAGGREGNGAVTDDQLRLIFICCHPALRTEHQVALTLRLLGGLSVEEIARGFLVTETAMAKRLGRAKYKIKAARIPYRVPVKSDLPHRLRPVLSVIYLIYNAGTDELDERAPLRQEAIRLTRALASLMSGEPEVAGLLALLLLNESRVPARSGDGSIVLLRDQDRTMWDQRMIDEGHAIVRACIDNNESGPYQLQAAIQAVHCSAETFEVTDWPQILTLYDHLFSVMPSAVVALNRAIAVSEADGPVAGLVALDAISPDLVKYHLLHAARATALRRLGRIDEARDAYATAADLATVAADRDHLLLQIRALDGGET